MSIWDSVKNWVSGTANAVKNYLVPTAYAPAVSPAAPSYSQPSPQPASQPAQPAYIDPSAYINAAKTGQVGQFDQAIKGWAQNQQTNIRSGSSTGSSIMKTIGPNDYVTILGVDNGWYIVDAGNGKTGYVRGDVLNIGNDRNSAVKGATYVAPSQPVQSVSGYGTATTSANPVADWNAAKSAADQKYRNMVIKQLQDAGLYGNADFGTFDRAASTSRAEELVNPWFTTQQGFLNTANQNAVNQITATRDQTLGDVNLQRQVQAFNFNKNTTDILNQLASQNMARSGTGLRQQGLNSVDNSYRKDAFQNQENNANQNFSLATAQQANTFANQNANLLDSKNQRITGAVDADATAFQQQMQQWTNARLNAQNNIINSVWAQNPYTNGVTPGLNYFY